MDPDVEVPDSRVDLVRSRAVVRVAPDSWGVVKGGAAMWFAQWAVKVRVAGRECAVNSRVMTSGWNVGSAADRAVLVMGGSRGNAVPDSAPDRAQRECAVEKALTRTTSVPATSKTAVGGRPEGAMRRGPGGRPDRPGRPDEGRAERNDDGGRPEQRESADQ